MPRASSVRSRFIAAVAFLNLVTLNGPVQGQALAQPIRVTSCVASQPGALTLVTTSSTPLAAPIIQYLPGPDECTVLAADFAGLTWVGEPRIIRPESSTGIIQVRIGQLQSAPPICRVSVTSKNPKLFKGVTFKNLAGQLVVRWNAESGSVASALPNSLPEQRRLLPVYTQDEPNKSGPSRRLLPAHLPGDAEEGAPRIVEAETPVTRLLPPTPPNYAGSPSFLPHVSYGPMPAPPSSSGYDPGSSQLPPTDQKPVEQPKVTGFKVIKRSSPTTDDSSIAPKAKSSGIFHKIAAKTEKLLNAKDRESHDKLTKAEPGKVAAIAQTDTMKEQATDMQPAAPDASLGAVQQTDSTGKPTPPPLAIQMSTEEGSVVENLKIDVSALRKLSYKTFRMHNPERYVIDFDQLPELTSLRLPDSDSPLFFRFRTGTLPDKPNTDRLVIDLPDEEVKIKDNYDEDKNTLSLYLFRKDETLSGATVNGAAPITAATLPAELLTPQTNVVPPTAPSVPGKKVIVLDAGHGGSDPGAQRSDISEKDLTLAIVNKLKHVLEQQGCTVIMTRSDDTFVSLEDRVKITNQVLPDLFLSVHINAMESANDIAGIETYYQTDQSKPLAESVHSTLVAGLGAQDRSVRKARFYVINHTQVPAILAEVGFISNKDERQKLDTADYQERIAESLARGVNTYVSSHDTHSALAQSNSNKAGSAGTAEGTSTPSTKSLSSNFAARSSTHQTAF